MTRAAFSLWNNRIAPVFDVARHLLIVDVDNGMVIGGMERRFASDNPHERALRLSSLEIDQLVCGAISRDTAETLEQNGIQVISFVTGDCGHVVQAWLKGRLHDNRLLMPGCNRRKHRGSGCAGR